MFNPAQIRDAVRAAGLTTPVDVTVNGVPYPGINVKWWQPDALYADGFSQQTDYHIEYWTEDLPSLKKGDEIVADGNVYEVADTPAFAIGKSGGHYSRVRLLRTTRSYPKLAITRGTPSVPGPAQPVPDGAHVAPYSFAFGDATPALVFTVPIGYAVTGFVVDVDVAFNGVGAQVQLGGFSAPGIYVGAADLDPAMAAQYEIPQDPAIAAGQSIYLVIVPGAAATQGAGKVYLQLSPA